MKVSFKKLKIADVLNCNAGDMMDFVKETPENQSETE